MWQRQSWKDWNQYTHLSADTSEELGRLVKHLYLHDGQLPAKGEPVEEAALTELAQEREDYLTAVNVVDLLVAAGLKTVLIEDEYIDLDFRTAFSRLYYSRHFDTPRRCQRLHFFSEHVPFASFKRVNHQLSDSYLGYCVLRPLPGYRLGTSVFSIELYREGHPVCATDYTANIAGNAVTIRAIPWMQQDNLVAACATISIWVATHYLSRKFAPEFQSFHTSEITDLSGTAGRRMPNVGLMPEEMLQALHAMNYQPIQLIPRTLRSAQRITYSMVESAIPVIVTFQNTKDLSHAVTVVGHLGPEDVHAKAVNHSKVQTMQLYDHAEAIPGFLVQDDMNGPGRKLTYLSREEAIAGQLPVLPAEEPLEKGSDGSVFKPGDPAPTDTIVAIDLCKKIDPETNREVLVASEVGELVNILVPLPKFVLLDSDQAFWRSVRRVNNALKIMSPETSEVPQLAARCFLIRSNSYKTWLGKAGLGKRLTHTLRLLPMAKWIWVTEVGTHNSYEFVGQAGDTHHIQSGQVVARIIADAGGMNNMDTPDDIVAGQFYDYCEINVNGVGNDEPFYDPEFTSEPFQGLR